MQSDIEAFEDMFEAKVVGMTPFNDIVVLSSMTLNLYALQHQFINGRDYDLD